MESTSSSDSGSESIDKKGEVVGVTACPPPVVVPDAQSVDADVGVRRIATLGRLCLEMLAKAGEAGCRTHS